MLCQGKRHFTEKSDATWKLSALKFVLDFNLSFPFHMLIGWTWPSVQKLKTKVPVKTWEKPGVNNFIHFITR